MSTYNIELIENDDSKILHFCLYILSELYFEMLPIQLFN